MDSQTMKNFEKRMLYLMENYSLSEIEIEYIQQSIEEIYKITNLYRQGKVKYSDTESHKFHEEFIKNRVKSLLKIEKKIVEENTIVKSVKIDEKEPVKDIFSYFLEIAPKIAKGVYYVFNAIGEAQEEIDRKNNKDKKKNRRRKKNKN